MPVRVCPAYASCGRSPYVATFHESLTGLDGYYCSQEKVLRLHLLAQLSGLWDPPQFLSQDSHWSSRLKPNTCGWPTTRLTVPITPACDRYIQYLLIGTNPSVLNWHRRGLPHRKPRNSHNTLPALPFWGLHWSPNGPARSQIIQITFYHFNWRGKQALNLVSGSLHSTSIITYHLCIAWANDVPPRYGQQG
jgi:hypothetical protein